MMWSNCRILCFTLLLPLVFPSIMVFCSESVLHIRWPKCWSFSFSISPSNEYSGLISFRIYWFNFLAVQGTLKSFLQHHSSKASILWPSAFFMIHLSHPYMTTGKTIALTRWILSISYLGLLQLFFQEQTSLNFKAAVTICIDFGDQENKVCQFPFGMASTDAMIFIFWMLSFKPTFSLSSFTFIKRPFSSYLLSAIWVVTSAYLRLLIFLQAILIPACD